MREEFLEFGISRGVNPPLFGAALHSDAHIPSNFVNMTSFNCTYPLSGHLR
jgi:hypothetical protein